MIGDGGGCDNDDSPHLDALRSRIGSMPVDATTSAALVALATDLYRAGLRAGLNDEKAAESAAAKMAFAGALLSEMGGY